MQTVSFFTYTESPLSKMLEDSVIEYNMFKV